MPKEIADNNPRVFLEALIEEHNALSKRINRLLSSLLLLNNPFYFSLPVLADLIFFRAPWLPLQNILYTRANHSIKLNMVDRLQQTLQVLQKKWGENAIYSLNSDEIARFEFLKSQWLNASLDNAATLYSTGITNGSFLLNDTRYGKNFRSLTAILGTVVAHTLNQFHNYLYVLPLFLGVRFSAFLLKWFVLDPILNRLFPNGIHHPKTRKPLIFSNYYQYSDIKIKKAVLPDLKSSVQRMRIIDVSFRFFSLISTASYGLYLVWLAFNDPAVNVDLRELKMINALIAPTICALFFYSLGGLPQTCRDIYNAWCLNRKLNVLQNQLKTISQSMDESCVNWSILKSGHDLRYCSFKLHVQKSIKNHSIDLKRKTFIHALKNVFIYHGIQVRYTDAENIYVSANFYINEHTQKQVVSSLKKYCENLTRINRHRKNITAQQELLAKKLKQSNEVVKTFDHENFPVLIYKINFLNFDDDLKQKLIDAFKKYYPENYLYWDDSRDLLEIKNNKPLNKDNFNALIEAIENILPDNEPNPFSVNSAVQVTKDETEQVLREPLSKFRHQKDGKAIVRKEGIKSEKSAVLVDFGGGDIYDEAHPEKSTVFPMKGVFCRAHTLFAKLNIDETVADQRLREKFSTIVKNGQIVPRTGSQGIVMSECNYVRDPIKGRAVRTSFKVKPLGEYGNSRLYAERVKSVTSKGAERTLHEFKYCVYKAH